MTLLRLVRRDLLWPFELRGRLLSRNVHNVSGARVIAHYDRFLRQLHGKAYDGFVAREHRAHDERRGK